MYIFERRVFVMRRSAAALAELEFPKYQNGFSDPKEIIKKRYLILNYTCHKNKKKTFNSELYMS